MTLKDTEQDKYTNVWKLDDYRRFSPGESMQQHFLDIVQPSEGTRIIDYGAGTGRASLFFHDHGYDVWMVDIADNCLDDEVKQAIGDRLYVESLWEMDALYSPYGYCCDVMEHIPPRYVDKVLANIMGHSRKVFFNICFTEDHFGSVVGDHLHLTVKPFTWWRDRLKKAGTLIEARDLIYTGMFVLESVDAD
jgi:hypothetical protein